MARLWDVGKSEPIKVGKASPTEGALPSALYFALKYGPSNNFQNSRRLSFFISFCVGTTTTSSKPLLQTPTLVAIQPREA
jgi:hypothetical protein